MVNHEFNLNNTGVSNSLQSASFPRHRWYSYKEGFSPSLVQSALNSIEFDEKSDIIFDPFNGSGTVTLFSALSGYQSIGHEVNPFSSFISNVKQTVLSKNALLGFEKEKDKLLKNIKRGKISPLATFSTFSESPEKDKWLFNKSVLHGFEGGYRHLKDIGFPDIRSVFKLALINSAMENCNAKKDGKCLRYRHKWTEKDYSKESFAESVRQSLDVYYKDITESEIKVKSQIHTGDTRKLSLQRDFNFKLCITSPPYLNSFDYTDVYRPELFLGEFLTNQDQFNSLKHRTFRSHVTFDCENKAKMSFGAVYDTAIKDINEKSSELWHSKIPLMIQCYFEDMKLLLTNLLSKAAAGAEVWIVVANSAYNGTIIPTDLIIGEIGAQAGWFLKEIGVLRYINKRGSKYSPKVKNLRESVIILSKKKF